MATCYAWLYKGCRLAMGAWVSLVPRPHPDCITVLQSQLKAWESHETVIDFLVNTHGTITCTAALRVWHLSAFHCNYNYLCMTRVCFSYFPFASYNLFEVFCTVALITLVAIDTSGCLIITRILNSSLLWPLENQNKTNKQTNKQKNTTLSIVAPPTIPELSNASGLTCFM